MRVCFIIALLAVLFQHGLAEITVTFDGSQELDVVTTNGEDCVLSIDNGFVKVNGVDPDTGPLSVDDLFRFDFNGDNLANHVDVSALTVAEFSSFGSIDIDTNGGDDTVIGSEFNDTYRLDDGIDTIQDFGGGNDIVHWSNGDGSETHDNTSGVGTVRLLFGGSTGDDDLIVDATDNMITVTDNLTSEMISIINPTVLALQMNNGNDQVVVNDLSSLTAFTEIFCNKSDGEYIFDGDDSNVRVVLNSTFSSIGVSAEVTPFSNSEFSHGFIFGNDPVNFELTKSGEDILIDFDFPGSGSTHTVRGFSEISITGSANDDSVVMENIGSESLEQITFNLNDGSDSIETVLQTNTLIEISERTSFGGTDSLIVDAQDNPAADTGSVIEALGEFGNIEYENLEDVQLLNARSLPDDLWLMR